MSSARITSRIAREAVSLLDEDFVALERDDAAAVEVAEIYALVEEAEREWAAADVAESFRVSRYLTDQARAHRAHRRAAREALRTLHEGFLIGGMQKQGKTAAARAVLLDLPIESEAA